MTKLLRDTPGPAPPPPQPHTRSIPLEKPRKQPIPRATSPSRPLTSRRPGAGTPWSWAVWLGPASPGLQRGWRTGPEKRAWGPRPAAPLTWADLGALRPGGPRQRDPGPGKDASSRGSHRSKKSRGELWCGRARRPPASPLRAAPGCGRRGPPLPGRPRADPRRSPRSPSPFPSAGLRELSSARRCSGPQSCSIRLAHRGVAHGSPTPSLPVRCLSRPSGHPQAGGRAVRPDLSPGPPCSFSSRHPFPVPERDAAPKFSPAGK